MIMHVQAKKLGIDREMYVAASDDQFPDHASPSFPTAECNFTAYADPICAPRAGKQIISAGLSIPVADASKTDA